MRLLPWWIKFLPFSPSSKKYLNRVIQSIINSNHIEELDKTLRYKMFYTAVHYYEAKYLIDCEKFDTKNFYSKNRFKANVNLVANVTPCFISTFHSNIKNFSYVTSKEKDNCFNEPYKEIADLLIIDEAGQTPPDLSVVSFCLARKAFVVGDTKQIEPVYPLTKNVDRANMIKSGLVDPQDEWNDICKFENLGFSATNGNIMKLAQKSSLYQLNDLDERGFMLQEHRRCYDSIIQYCNELCYHGKLIPLKGNRKIGENDLPLFGYANISGDSKRYNGSRQNEKEAEVIADWIVRHKIEFENKYNSSIEDCLAVVTPFKAQANLIKKNLGKRGLQEANSSQFKIGTVHSLQGAEKNIIIFSPVYGNHDTGINYFFDRSTSMLNVAVSRAKESFLVFGCMNNFDPSKENPSGILAKYLFDAPENEITDIRLNLKTIDKKDFKTIDNHEDHIRYLKQTLLTAKKEVLITSPFIRIDAVMSDGLLDSISSAVNKGVIVKVYTDSYFDYQCGQQLESSKSGHNALRRSGANIHIKDRIHNKTLVMDNILFSEGSFNWFSAVNNKKSKFYRLDRTIVYSGNDAQKYIMEFKKQINSNTVLKRYNSY